MLILNNKFFIVLLPFLSFAIIAFIFFFLQIISKKKVSNFIISALSLILLNFIFLLVYFNSLTILDLTFIILTTLMNIYIFLNTIQLPVSSIQINILRLINKKNMSKKKLLRLYNDNKIFYIRLKRLTDSGIIKYEKDKFIIQAKFIVIILNIFLFLKKITKDS